METSSPSQLVFQGQLSLVVVVILGVVQLLLQVSGSYLSIVLKKLLYYVNDTVLIHGGLVLAT